MENALVLEEFVVQMGGPRRACELYFSDPSLSLIFTRLMAEKYGELISKSWLFLQRDYTNKSYIPLEGEKCFDINRGNISGIQRALSPEEYKMALRMVAEISNLMNLNVYRRTATNMSEHAMYGDQLKYQYEPIQIQVNSNTNSNLNTR